ncbi:BN6_48550 family protein [Streptomyces sp. NBC_01550]|uniref:CATRA conflict system CASPASE/TPR repeat-associated protein n=1 Tax=Streptomyces sp. NBC_01550 TaxID=2975875 RepID=UPI003867D107
MFARPALLIHEFHPAPRSEADEVRLRDRVSAWWDRCAAFGMDSPIALPDLPMDLPASMDEAAPYALLAGRRSAAGDGALYQALVYAAHDVIGLVALLAPNDDSADWHGLDGAWTAPQTEAAPLGSARVHLAVVAEDAVQQHLNDLAVALGAALPAAGDGAWARRRCRTPDGFLLWEAPACAASERRLVVVAPVAHEADLDAWAWTSGAGTLGPFVRYLLHAAKLRYEQAVLERESAQLRRLRRDTDDAVDAVLALQAHDGPAVTPARLLDADLAVGRLQAKSDGVITALAALHALDRTALIAHANMRSVLAGSAAPGSPVATDRELATWLRDRLADEIGYLSTTQKRAERVSRMSGAAVKQHLNDYQQRLAVLQTSFLGALLMALAAVQTFGYQVPLPGRIQAPVIAVLAALALALPSGVQRWSRANPGDAPLGAIDTMLVACLGGAVGWLAVAVLSHELTGRPSQPGWTVLAGLIGAGAAVLFARRRLRQ